MNSIVFMIGLLLCGNLALASENQEDKVAGSWSFTVRADQQESFGYDASVGIPLPAVDSTVLPFLKYPGSFFSLGAGERLFTDSTGSSTIHASSWHAGLGSRFPVSEHLFLSSLVRRVQVKLPEKSSKKTLDYLETGFGLGVGSVKGMMLELGTTVRYITKMDKPVQVGNAVIQDKLSLYPTLSLGFQL